LVALQRRASDETDKTTAEIRVRCLHACSPRFNEHSKVIVSMDQLSVWL